MKLEQFLGLFEKAGKRFHLVGDKAAGLVIGLDLEGRIFAVIDGRIVNRTNPDAVLGQSGAGQYLNPGGDGLWPAPEGTRLGYEYASGKWRVPPSLTGARYIVTEQAKNRAKVEAEIDLINNSSLGIPTIFSREAAVESCGREIKVTVREQITYVGTRTLGRRECLLAPWTLCQFDSGPGTEVVFPQVQASEIWDFYGDSSSERCVRDGLWHTVTDGKMRYQIALGSGVEWIEFSNPSRGIKAFRTAEKLPGEEYIDIADAPPDQNPSEKGVRFSVYSDKSNFMEIEAVGGCPETISPGHRSAVLVTTIYKK